MSITRLKIKACPDRSEKLKQKGVYEMTAMQMVTNLRDEELEVNLMHRDYEVIDALDAAIEVMTTGKTEANKTKTAKVLLDVRDNLQYPEDDEFEAMTHAIIAVIKAA